LERDVGDGFWVAWISIGIGGWVLVEVVVVVGEEAIGAAGLFEERLQRRRT
jgi:hypothetical protein